MSGKTKKRSNSKNRHDIEYVDSFKPMIDDLTDEPKTKEKFKFKAKNPKQQKAWENLHDNLVNFLIGKVGSGKTYLAVAYAVKMLQEKKVKRIVLLRPATVNSLEQIGFLKGTLEDKVSPLILPMKSIFEELLGKVVLEQYMERGVIQPYSIAYVEGMTYKNSIVLVDEYQNTSSEMLRAILTRIDDTSQCIVMGDENQIKLDNPMISASKDVARFKDKKGIGYIEFEDHEIVRGKITELIESCYDKKPKIQFNIESKEKDKAVFKGRTAMELISSGEYEQVYLGENERVVRANDGLYEIQKIVEQERNKYKGISEGIIDYKIDFPNTSYNAEDGV